MKLDIWEKQNKETCNLTLEAHKIASLKAWYFNEYLIILLSKIFYPFYIFKNTKTKTALRQMDIYGSTLKGIRLQFNTNRFDTSFIIQLPLQWVIKSVIFKIYWKFLRLVKKHTQMWWMQWTASEAVHIHFATCADRWFSGLKPFLVTTEWRFTFSHILY